MCGIAGYSGDFDAGLLELMNHRIAHRGPDDGDILRLPKQGLGFAHRRLAIIDLSPLGRQPMWDHTRTAVIVFNGEIYNYRELRKELEDKGHKFKSHTDTEVLLNLYLSDGTEMLKRLNGIFAFAIWDERDRSIFLARDGAGVKPLYFSEVHKGFLFASELKALLEENSIDREIDPRAILHYLTFLWCPAPATMLNGVKKLEPGHALIVKDGRVRKKWQFYDLPIQNVIEPLSVEEGISRVREQLTEAVRRQMVADVEVGAFLSGGLDSSLIVAMARPFALNGRLQCFTIGFRDKVAELEGMTEDLPYAQRVALHLGVDLHTIYVGPEMADHLERMIYYLDEPQGDPAPLNALFISELARQKGIKVLLSGAGGDDLLGGYRRHYALLQEKYWEWAPKPARHLLSIAAKALPVSRALGRRARKAFEYADLDGDKRLISYFYWMNPDLLQPLFGPSLKETLANVQPSVPLQLSLNKLPANLPKLSQMLYLEGKHFLPDHNLNYTDKMSMAVGVEVRVPFLDPDFISLSARLPAEFKQRGRVGKWILKRAAEHYLPREVIYRPKTGFGAPLRHWLRHELRSVVEEVLSERSLTQRGLFDHREVQNLVRMNLDGRVDGTYTIFSLICIELWCRIFLDRKLFSRGITAA